MPPCGHSFPLVCGRPSGLHLRDTQSGGVVRACRICWAAGMGGQMPCCRPFESACGQVHALMYSSSAVGVPVWRVFKRPVLVTLCKTALNQGRQADRCTTSRPAWRPYCLLCLVCGCASRFVPVCPTLLAASLKWLVGGVVVGTSLFAQAACPLHAR